MKKGFYFSVFRIVRRLGYYSSFVFLFVCIFNSKISHDQRSILISQGMGIHLQIFSPAYAAFEDEFLFDEFDQMESETIHAGSSNELYLAQADSPSMELMNITSMAFQMSLPPEVEDMDSVEANPFVSAKPVHTKIGKPTIQPINKLAVASIKAPPIAISIGPIVAFKKPHSTSPQYMSPTIHAKPGIPHQTEPSFEEHQAARPSVHKIAGNLELAGGIAFLGDLEVSWVVEDEEYAQGQIWLKEGYYEVPVDHLIGDIVISLYDEKNNLVGEGIAHLDELSTQPGFNPEQVDIEIRAVDTSLAGRVFNGEYIEGKNRPVNGAEVTLFGSNASAQTDEHGQYRFANWKASDSRTIALASKNGFKDSVFIIDSSQTHKVFLFKTAYIKTLFNRLIEIGYDSDVREEGLVYGRVQENGKATAGITVSIDGHKTSYFSNYYIPETSQIQTSSNGQFTVPGLGNGEHELMVERAGKVVDRRIVVVEDGKVSPLVIDIGSKPKKVKFFDPLHPKDKVAKTGYRFFDGEEYLLAEKDGRAQTTTTKGKEPALLEFAQSTGDENNIFINRAKKFEQIPIVNTKWFQDIKRTYKLDVSDGLAVGFIHNDEPFVVSVAEAEPDEVLYFDKKGAIIQPSDDTAPAGFILIGLQKGLHTLICESRSGPEIFFTDVIYNNHQSVSVIYKNLN